MFGEIQINVCVERSRERLARYINLSNSQPTGFLILSKDINLCLLIEKNEENRQRRSSGEDIWKICFKYRKIFKELIFKGSRNPLEKL